MRPITMAFTARGNALLDKGRFGVWICQWQSPILIFGNRYRSRHTNHTSHTSRSAYHQKTWAPAQFQFISNCRCRQAGYLHFVIGRNTIPDVSVVVGRSTSLSRTASFTASKLPQSSAWLDRFLLTCISNGQDRPGRCFSMAEWTNSVQLHSRRPIDQVASSS